MLGPRFAQFGAPEVPRANDNAAVRRAAKRERQREELAKGWYLESLKSYGGRAMLNDLLERFETFATGFVRDPHERDFLAGQRHCGVTLFNDLAAVDAELTLLMQAEARQRQEKEAVERRAYHKGRAGDAGDETAEGLAERAGAGEDEETDDR